MTTKIAGTGSYLPDNHVTNDFLATIVDTSDEWIKSRTGIGSRYIATEDTTASMAVKACQKAMAEAGIGPGEVDLIIVGTISPDLCLPSTACQIQKELQLCNAVAFDINASCSGFLYALNTAHAYLSSGLYQTALIVGVEILSKMMDWNDRGTCVLFGDGAGAAVVKADSEGIIDFVQKSDGSRLEALICQGRQVNNPFVNNSTKLHYVHMDGQEVYKFVSRQVPACIRESLERSKLSPEDIKYFVLHQANIRIIEAVSKRLEIPMEKFPLNLERCGNMSAASVPVLLDEINKKGMLRRGDKILLCAFGAGLTWGATTLVW